MNRNYPQVVSLAGEVRPGLGKKVKVLVGAIYLVAAMYLVAAVLAPQSHP
jgi:hypothetical protein